MKITKSFLKMWVLQMLQNSSFLNDPKLTGDMVGAAVSGDLNSLQNMLTIYLPHAEVSVTRNGFPTLPTNDSVQDVIDLITDKHFEVI